MASFNTTTIDSPSTYEAKLVALDKKKFSLVAALLGTRIIIANPLPHLLSKPQFAKTNHFSS